jgi:hypothetical protein
MSKLKLGTIVDDKPVRLSIEISAAAYRDLIAYAEVLEQETGEAAKPVQLVGPMLARFMSTDRAFLKLRRISNYGCTPSRG